MATFLKKLSSKLMTPSSREDLSPIGRAIEGSPVLTAVLKIVPDSCSKIARLYEVCASCRYGMCRW